MHQAALVEAFNQTKDTEIKNLTGLYALYS